MTDPSEESFDDLAVSLGVLRIGDVLSTTGRAIGANIVTITLVTVICLLPAMGVDLLATEITMRESQRIEGEMRDAMEAGRPMPDDLFDERSGLAGVSGDLAGYGPILSWILHALLTMFAQAAMMFCVVEFLAGRKAGVGASLRIALARFISVLFTSILFWIIVALPAALLGGIFFFILFSGGPGGLLSMGGFGLLVVPLAALLISLIVTCFFYVAVPAAVCERLGPVDSLRRSVTLTESNRARIFLCLLIVGVGLWLLAAGVSALGFLTSFGRLEGGGLFSETGPTFYLTWALGWIPKLLQTVLFSVLGAVIYARLRGVRDGIDAEALAELFA